MVKIIKAHGTDYSSVMDKVQSEVNDTIAYLTKQGQVVRDDVCVSHSAVLAQAGSLAHYVHAVVNYHQ